MAEAKKLIDGDTYRKLSDERLAEILIADSCSFNNSTKFKDSPKLVLEDLKLKIKQLKEDLPGPKIRKHKHDSANTNVFETCIKDIFHRSKLTLDCTNNAGQICKERLSKHYEFKHIEMVHILDRAKNPVLYPWIGNICAISKPNKSYTDTGSNGMGREQARLLWQKDQFSYIPDSIAYYNQWLIDDGINDRITAWCKANPQFAAYEQSIKDMFAPIQLT